MKDCISLTGTVNQAHILSQRIRYPDKESVLTSKERLIVFAMTTLLEPADTEFSEFRCPLSSFCKLLHIDMAGGLQQRHFFQSLENLKNQGFYINKSNGTAVKIRAWMSEAYYDKEKKEVVLRLHDDLKPYLLHLEGKTRTLFQLGYAVSFKLRHTAALYALLHSSVGLKGYRIPIDRLRGMLGTRYPKYTDLKHFVLEPSLAEINQTSDILAAEKPIKKNGRIVGISFYVRMKGKREKKGVEPVKFPDNKKKITEQEFMMLPSGYWCGIPSDDDDNRCLDAQQRISDFRASLDMLNRIMRQIHEPPFCIFPIWRMLWENKRKKRRKLQLAG